MCEAGVQKRCDPHQYARGERPFFFPKDKGAVDDAVATRGREVAREVPIPLMMRNGLMQS